MSGRAIRSNLSPWIRSHYSLASVCCPVIVVLLIQRNSAAHSRLGAVGFTRRPVSPRCISLCTFVDIASLRSPFRNSFLYFLIFHIFFFFIFVSIFTLVLWSMTMDHSVVQLSMWFSSNCFWFLIKSRSLERWEWMSRPFQSNLPKGKIYTARRFVDEETFNASSERLKTKEKSGWKVIGKS